MPLSRLLFLVVVFGLMVWFFVVPSINEPAVHRPVLHSLEEETSQGEGPEPRTREETAVWREQLDRRLYRR